MSRIDIIVDTLCECGHSYASHITGRDNNGSMIKGGLLTKEGELADGLDCIECECEILVPVCEVGCSGTKYPFTGW